MADKPSWASPPPVPRSVLKTGQGTVPSPVTKQRPQARKARRGGCAVAALSAAVTFMVVVMLVLVGLVYVYFSDWNVPGVQSLGADLGGKTTTEAVKALRHEWAQRSIVVTDGTATWTLPPERLGITLDVDAMIRQSHELGRTPDSLREVIERRGEITIPPIWKFDRGTADALLGVMAGQLEVAPQNAGVRVVNGQLEASTATLGRRLDVTATLNWLQAHTWDAVLQRHLNLVVVPVQPAYTDVGPALARAQLLLADPISVRLYDPVKDEKASWTITQTVMGGWLLLHGDPAKPGSFDWMIDPARVEAYLLTQAATLGSDRYIQTKDATAAVTTSMTGNHGEVRLRVYHHPQKHVVTAGETLSSIALEVGVPYPWIQQSNGGLGDDVRAGQVITVPSLDLFVPLPVVENKRIVVNITKQKMWDYENGKVKWEWQASTGIRSSPTNPGVFQIQTHEPNAYAANWNLWMPYFMGIYRPVPISNFMNGFHGFPKRGGTQLLWTDDLGHPVTYGCILVSSENAKTLFDWAEEGTVVVIQP
jgi:LysM repeat protein